MRCKVPQYTYDTEEDIAKTSTVSEHLQLLILHVDAGHPKPPPQQPATTDQPTQARTEKINHPKLELKDGSTSEESWEFFTFSWPQYNWKCEGEIGGLPGGDGGRHGLRQDLQENGKCRDKLAENDRVVLTSFQQKHIS